MGKTNYSKMSNKAKDDAAPTFVETTSFDAVPAVEEVVIPEVEAIIEEVPVVEEAPVEKKAKIGVVVDCVKLNVRSNPSPMADIELTIDKGTEVEIVSESGDFYHVRKSATTYGFNGWCMKKYISVK